MKKALLLSVAALTAFAAVNLAEAAETVKGKVVSQKGNVITLEQADGKVVNVQTSDDTTYRKKKMMKKNKKKHGKTYQKGSSYYMPMMEEDDWIEVTYTTDPKTNAYVVEDVVVYDD